jgi:acetyl-CoA synthetase
MYHIKSKADYSQQYQASIADPQKFWAEIASNFVWFEKFTQTSNCNLEQGQIEWFKNGKTNISHNCLDRHLETLGDKTAIIWESNDPQEKSQKITYKELHAQTCQFANLLLACGVKAGDRVCIYMPMIPQSVVAMLACARIGAIHSVVFAGFSAKSLAGRIQDCGAKILITADLLFRGEKEIELFEIAKEALLECVLVETVVIYKRGEKELLALENSRLNCLLWQDEIKKYSSENRAAALDSENPLFILYTSGSTGNPKGIVHSTGGYMVYAGYSFQNVFQYQQGDIHFCTADIGWITGHSYLVYGPLLNGATILMFEGIPTHPTPARFWEVIEKHQVNIFYTAPTAIRALMQKGDEFVSGHDLSSLKTLGSVGEPINEEAWNWYNEKIGQKKCPIVDTWWQTETGGILISTMAGVTESKPAHAGLPMPGIVPILLDDSGKEILEKNKIGNLCFSQAWPAIARDIWGDHEKFLKTYLQPFPKYYLAGDGAFQNEDGLYRIIGRTDDVIKVSGHRLGTAEIENAINSHPKVSESAVIGLLHQIKGEGIYAFVILKNVAENLEAEILAIIQKEIGAIARPEKIYFVADLPKTRSGKIMRRILKKIIAGEENLGDISTLVNPETVEQLKNLK